MYFIKRLFSIDVKRMFSILKKIAKRSGKPFIYILVDVIICGFKYGAGYMDYFVFNFEELNSKQRKTYITRTINDDYIKACNKREFYHFFAHKPDFLRKFKEFIKRDFVDLKVDSYQDYLEFVNKHKVFMAKPTDGMCGYGIDVVDSSDKDLKDLYDLLIQRKQYLLEEKIVQDKRMSDLYPCSINTIRLVTLRKGDDVEFLFSAIRIGNNGKHVDNFNNGGLFTVVDEDGVIRKPALDKEGVEYINHPYTNHPIVGYKVPMFDEIKAQAKKMAFVVPEIRLVGWDFCLSEKGIDVVEGNEYPGYDIYQSKQHLDEDRIGLKEKFDKAIYNN